MGIGVRGREEAERSNGEDGARGLRLRRGGGDGKVVVAI